MSHCDSQRPYGNNAMFAPTKLNPCSNASAEHASDDFKAVTEHPDFKIQLRLFLSIANIAKRDKFENCQRSVKLPRV